MTRQEYIDAVKAKLDDISPFDEPGEFIAADGDSDYDKVKPIINYIDSELDNAARFCLSTLPFSILADDMIREDFIVRGAANGEYTTGYISDIYDYMRLCRLHVDQWEKDVVSFITPSSPIYLLQQNPYTRGGRCKPIAAYNPEKNAIECYSMKFTEENDIVPLTCVLYYIELRDVKAEDVESDIEDFIVLMCAAYVLDILKDTNSSKLMRDKFAEKLQTIMA